MQSSVALHFEENRCVFEGELIAANFSFITFITSPPPPPPPLSSCYLYLGGRRVSTGCHRYVQSASGRPATVDPVHFSSLWPEEIVAEKNKRGLTTENPPLNWPQEEDRSSSPFDPPVFPSCCPLTSFIRNPSDGGAAAEKQQSLTEKQCRSTRTPIEQKSCLQVDSARQSLRFGRPVHTAVTFRRFNFNRKNGSPTTRPHRTLLKAVE